MQKNNRKNMSYSFEIKLKAVKMYLEEGIGSNTIAKELNLSSNKRVLLLLKRYNEFGEDGLRERRVTTRGLQKGRSRKRELSLEEENQISINLHLINTKLNKVCQEKKSVIIMHALKVFGYLKTELIYQNSYSFREELIKSIDDYIHLYNNYRFQAKLKNMTPVEYRCHMIA